MKRLRIGIVGQHEVDYPRNVTNQALLQRLGHELVQIHSRDATPLRMAKLIAGSLHEARGVDAFFMTEGSHMYVPMVAPIARTFSVPLIFDAFTSKYNTYVEDRRKYARRSLGALRCHLMDAGAVATADHCVFDTHEHAAYFAQRYGIRGSSHVLEVAVDETTFLPCPPQGDRSALPPSEPLRVLFYGTYIPLQGIEHIIEAARLLIGEPFAFTLIGKGQTYEAVRRRATGLRNIDFVDPVTPRELVAAMHGADVCLGIFGDTEKAGNVVPNKVVQAAACARPLITRRSASIDRYFTHLDHVYLVDPASPEQLATALRELRERPWLRKGLASGARSVFEEHFSFDALSKKMAAIVDLAVNGTPDS